MEPKQPFVPFLSIMYVVLGAAHWLFEVDGDENQSFVPLVTFKIYELSDVML